MRTILFILIAWIPIVFDPVVATAQPVPDHLSATMQTSSAPRLTLPDCLESALKSNFDILIGKNQVEMAKNNVTATPFLPVATANARNTQNINSSDTYNALGEEISSSSNLMNYSAGANMNWTLFDGLKMFATRALQEQLFTDGELLFRNRIETLTKDICSQYYLIISLQNQESLLEQLVETSRIRYNQALLRYNIGKDSGLESKQAKIDLNSDSSRLLIQRENVLNAHIELYRMINVPLDSKYAISDTIETTASLQLDELKEKTLGKNTSILRSKTGEKLSALDLKIAQAAKYPNLSVGAGYSYAYNQAPLYTSRYNDVSGFNWGLTLSVPIFNGLETNRKIKNARLDQDNARLTAAQTEQNVIASLLQLYNTYLNNIQLTGFESESVQVAAMNLEAAMAKYKIGSISGIQYRDIQISYLNAADRKLNAQYQAKLSEIQLQLLAGELF